MSEATVESGGLSNTFNKVNHWRHILMDISMLGMAISALVATGGATGFLDPIVGWLNMHVSGLSGWLELPEFFNTAAEQASNGNWYLGTEMDHTAMHTGAEHIGMSDMGHTPTNHTPSWQDQALYQNASQVAEVNVDELSDLMINHDTLASSLN